MNKIIKKCEVCLMPFFILAWDSLVEMFNSFSECIKRNLKLITSVILIVVVFAGVRYSDSEFKAFALMLFGLFCSSLFDRMRKRSGISGEIPIRNYRFTSRGKYGVQMDVMYQEEAMQYLYEMENFLESKGYASYRSD